MAQSSALKPEDKKKYLTTEQHQILERQIIRGILKDLHREKLLTDEQLVQALKLAETA